MFFTSHFCHFTIIVQCVCMCIHRITFSLARNATLLFHVFQRDTFFHSFSLCIYPAHGSLLSPVFKLPYTIKYILFFSLCVENRMKKKKTCHFPWLWLFIGCTRIYEPHLYHTKSVKCVRFIVLEYFNELVSLIISIFSKHLKLIWIYDSFFNGEFDPKWMPLQFDMTNKNLNRKIEAIWMID